jgi:hypothetical protein
MMTLGDCCLPLDFEELSGQTSPLAVRTIQPTEGFRTRLWLPFIRMKPAPRNEGYCHPGLSDRGLFPIREMVCRLPILIDPGID